MKRFRVFYGGLAGLAAACALGAWFAPVEAGWLAFPWGSIGAGLRALSLSGSMGNAAACGLYALLCLLPAGIALRDIRHRWPLVGFSAVLGPAPCAVPKVNYHFRYQLTLRCRLTRTMRQLLSYLLREFGKDKANRGVSAYIDVNGFD